MLFREVTASLVESGEVDIAEQLTRTVVVTQLLGNREPYDLTFSAYPLPRPAREQRESIGVNDFRYLDLAVTDAHLTILLDVFGQVDAFRFKGLPSEYRRLKSFMDMRLGDIWGGIDLRCLPIITHPLQGMPLI